jgi:hypothetical protein
LALFSANNFRPARREGNPARPWGIALACGKTHDLSSSKAKPDGGSQPL